ncbi:Flp family type IVb pilin [Arthrobacter sp. MPF02]|uniref:Flp family type IVb pilin n=1 Tax=Arthrobacter sp. MPF02 TaxID=3388492 RepID=UPI0039851D90
MLSLIATLHTAGFHLKNRLENEKGATAVEYGLLVALIAAVIIGLVVLLGNEINAGFKAITDKLPGAPAT